MLDPNNPQKYEYAMIDISQTDSNKKHCMDGCINLAEQADNEVRRLQENNRELCDQLHDEEIDSCIAHNTVGQLRDDINYMQELLILAAKDFVNQNGMHPQWWIDYVTKFPDALIAKQGA